MIKDRLKALQDKMSEVGIDLYYFNTSDYHMSEYVPKYFKTIEYFSGFTGSLATLLVSKQSAYIFVDGRYHTQADKQCLPQGIEVIKLGTAGALEPNEFIEKYYKDKVIGIDGKRTSASFALDLVNKNISIKSIDIYSELIENRAPLSTNKLRIVDLKYVGEKSIDKLNKINSLLDGKCHIVNNLESIAYSLNLRGDDIAYTPVFLAYEIFLDNNVYLFVNTDRLTDEIKIQLANDKVIVKEYDEYYDFLKTIKNKNITLDQNKVNYESYIRLKDDNDIENKRSIIEDLKAIKNDVEIQNAKKAHELDALAMIRFMMWLKSIDKTSVDECDVAEYLDNCRRNVSAYDLSFNSIVAYGENAAIVHYSPEKDKCARLDNKGVLLVDSGGQYNEGTTDITRTISLGETDEKTKKYFSLVLKSMFNMSELTFMSGVTGQMLDIVARKELWAEGVNFRHGTGHGVGHLLSVHEGPPNVRFMNTESENEKVELKPGMIFSDEPGIYFENEFGIRCENLVECKKLYENEYGEFLGLETLTLVPFDLDLIDVKYLDQKTIDILNKYHQRVYDTLLPYLNNEEKQFLLNATRKI